MTRALGFALGFALALSLTANLHQRHAIDMARAELDYRKSLHMADLDDYRRQQDDTLVQQFALMRRLAEALEDKRDDDALSHWGGKM